MRTVRAAGGVLWRPAADGPEVCVIHRPRYDDWSLPKGKLNPGEHPLAAAVREVREETEVRAVPQLRLPTIRYELRDEAQKVVEYWSMLARTDLAPAGFEPNSEVDSLCWLPVPAALPLLSYPHDVAVLGEFADKPPVTVAITVVRHAHAGRREDWPAPDAARPLDAAGAAEAVRLAELLALLEPQRLLSAAPRRCQQTLGPLAARVDLPIEIDSSFNEPRGDEEPARRIAIAADRLAALAAAGEPLALCSQGKVIPDMLARLSGAGSAKDFYTPKGTGWLLAFAGSRLVGTDRLALI